MKSGNWPVIAMPTLLWLCCDRVLVWASYVSVHKYILLSSRQTEFVAILVAHWCSCTARGVVFIAVQGKCL
uniref:Secreted protein n=1 Tax=Arundo donax TaxID=35708 RepID=A0A0A9ADL7_ARUDO